MPVSIPAWLCLAFFAGEMISCLLRIMKISLMNKISLDWPRWLYRLLLPGLMVLSVAPVQAQLASFNFSAAPVAVTGWTNLSGNPATAVSTATANGITVSSVATANWSPFTTDSSSYNGFGAWPGTYFPSAVMSDGW